MYDERLLSGRSTDTWRYEVANTYGTGDTEHAGRFVLSKYVNEDSIYNLLERCEGSEPVIPVMLGEHGLSQTSGVQGMAQLAVMANVPAVVTFGGTPESHTGNDRTGRQSHNHDTSNSHLALAMNELSFPVYSLYPPNSPVGSNRDGAPTALWRTLTSLNKLDGQSGSISAEGEYLTFRVGAHDAATH